jgi:hypothetical protein
MRRMAAFFLIYGYFWAGARVEKAENWPLLFANEQ